MPYRTAAQTKPPECLACTEWREDNPELREAALHVRHWIRARELVALVTGALAATAVAHLASPVAPYVVCALAFAAVAVRPALAPHGPWKAADGRESGQR